MRVTSNAVKRARQLRRKMTLPEVILWTALRGREPGKPTFRRQHPFGPYVLDFYCSRAKLCVEVDGGSHAFGDQPQRDSRRDALLRAHGITTVRVSATGVLDDATMIASSLIELARRRSAPSTTSWSPSPADAGEELGASATG
ncbi:endonuclease domain-containing protein [Phenylobacterium sp.]|uniref:endonuclease domain-containing protein n=1 Tax=Phenylobacterium sp. TaxID=1871053 RepID=UPI00345D975F|nr:endonuclease domain-containing protein [Phenylobacterium sp.]